MDNRNGQIGHYSIENTSEMYWTSNIEVLYNTEDLPPSYDESSLHDCNSMTCLPSYEQSVQVDVTYYNPPHQYGQQCLESDSSRSTSSFSTMQQDHQQIRGHLEGKDEVEGSGIVTSLILMIILFVFGGPFTFLCTIPAMIYFIRSTQTSNQRDKKYSRIIYIVGVVYTVLTFPLWICGIAAYLIIKG